MVTIPTVLQDRVTELNQLIQEHPQDIPLPEVAKFLNVDKEGLRRSIETGKCPFGISWQKTLNGNRAFKIPSLTFYLWVMAGQVEIGG